MLLLCGVGLVGILVIGASMSERPQDLILAKRIHIVDERGRVVAVLCSNGDRGQIYLKRASDNTPLIDLDSTLLNGDIYGGVIRVQSAEKKGSVELAISPDANARITLKNNISWKSLELSARNDGGRLEIMAGEVQPYTGIRIESVLEAVAPSNNAERRSRVEVFDGTNQIRVRLDTKNDAGSVETFDSGGLLSGRVPGAK